VADCPRAYGTENALKYHIKTKHPHENYVFSFSRFIFFPFFFVLSLKN
jgi:hypothetical protein